MRKICETMYRPEPNGLCGNDDSGQMAAWYVFSALGFYPFDACGGDCVIGAPLVGGATLSLPNGKVFRITVKGAGETLRSVTLNGRPLDVTKDRLRHADLLRGGELVFGY